MPELIEYVRTLSEEIGPRPAATDAEHRAAQWLERTFGGHGLETEMQTFDAPRTYSWAYVLYNLLTVASAVLCGSWVLGGKLAWAAFAVSAIVAFFFWLDLDTRWGLTRLLPKGPSQNVIARHIPRARRGERLRKIVIVAHYDSARSSLAFAPNMVKNFPVTMAMMKWATFLTPLFVLANAIPAADKLQPWLWYVTLAVAAYLVIPLLINVHRELAMPFVAGANDNATGVAAMLGVMERLVPAPDATSLVTTEFPALRRDALAAHEADVIPEGAELTYVPAQPAAPTELPDDFSWAEPQAEERGVSRRRDVDSAQGLLDFDTVEFGAIGEATPSAPASESGWAEDTGEIPSARDVLPAEIAGLGVDEIERPRRERKERRGGLFGGGREKKQRRGSRDDADPSSWLGVGDDFDARKAGKDIGSWDNFGANGEDSDDEGFGWKGGWAGDDPIGDPEFAASEAARIRRRVTESIDRELTEKEVWFVATGAEEVGTVGMQAFLHDYAADLRDALIINIDGCGSGHLYWASMEGMARRYRASARLVGLARRVSRETETLIKPRVYKGLSTDATPALARGFKAISIMAFDAGGLPENWHWKTDTIDAVDPELIETTADFVTAMVREA